MSIPHPRDQLVAAVAAIERLERAARATAELRFADECRSAGLAAAWHASTVAGQARLDGLLQDALRLRQSRLAPLYELVAFTRPPA